MTNHLDIRWPRIASSSSVGADDADGSDADDSDGSDGGDNDGTDGEFRY